jgi:hypothetical protein
VLLLRALAFGFFPRSSPRQREIKQKAALTQLRSRSSTRRSSRHSAQSDATEVLTHNRVVALVQRQQSERSDGGTLTLGAVETLGARLLPLGAWQLAAPHRRLSLTSRPPRSQSCYHPLSLDSSYPFNSRGSFETVRLDPVCFRQAWCSFTQELGPIEQRDEGGAIRVGAAEGERASTSPLAPS